jgi:hypothetical protein
MGTVSSFSVRPDRPAWPGCYAKLTQVWSLQSVERFQPRCRHTDLSPCLPRVGITCLLPLPATCLPILCAPPVPASGGTACSPAGAGEQGRGAAERACGWGWRERRGGATASCCGAVRCVENLPDAPGAFSSPANPPLGCTQ